MIADKPCLVVRFYPEGRSTPFDRYYDPETYLVVADGNTWFKRYYSDYRDVSGIKVPFVTRYDIDGKGYDMKLDSVVVNQQVDDGFFDPRPKKKK